MVMQDRCEVRMPVCGGKLVMQGGCEVRIPAQGGKLSREVDAM